MTVSTHQKAYKGGLSAEERARLRAAVGNAASEKIAKSEQLNFRIEENAIKELQNLAHDRKLPVSTMIHDWILERLAQEKFGKPEVTGKVLKILSEVHNKLHVLFESQRSKKTSGNLGKH